MTREQMELLIQTHGKSVYGFCFHLTGNREAAEDLYQDTMLKVYERRLASGEEDGELLRPRNYCMGVAARLYQNHRRKYLRRQTLSLDDEQNQIASVLSGGETTEQAVIRDMERRKVREAIEALPLKQRTVLYLFYYADVPIAEIARVLKVPEGTVKSRLNTARNQLKNRLKKEEKGGQENEDGQRIFI